ncbi:MAG TPA: hypothetical protein VGR76_10295 [Candidatus Angelobacter sp.]|jgi:hypothetical protein|nr:hypothetical protein [Candidatus Angelobacter sp.]
MILNTRKSVVQSRVSPENAPIQQIKAAGVTSRGQTTQGLPLPVSKVSAAIIKSGTNRIVRVSFVQNPADPYFVTAQLYMKQGTLTPTLLASGASPIIVTLPKSIAPTVITVVSSGNWGSTPLEDSPGTVVSLA